MCVCARAFYVCGGVRVRIVCAHANERVRCPGWVYVHTVGAVAGRYSRPSSSLSGTNEPTSSFTSSTSGAPPSVCDESEARYSSTDITACCRCACAREYVGVYMCMRAKQDGMHSASHPEGPARAAKPAWSACSSCGMYGTPRTGAGCIPRLDAMPNGRRGDCAVSSQCV